VVLVHPYLILLTHVSTTCRALSCRESKRYAYLFIQKLESVGISW